MPVRCQSSQSCVRYSSIIGAHFLTSPLSFLWVYGNLSAYMDSYFRFACSAKCADADSQWIIGLAMGMICPGVLITKQMADMTSLRVVQIVATIILNIGIFASAWTIGLSVAGTAMLLGVIMGAVTGVGSVVAFQYVSGWAPNKSSLFMATTSAASTLTSLIQNQVITAVVNPNNLKPDTMIGSRTFFSQKEILDQVPVAIMAYGAMNCALQLLGILLLAPRAKPDSVSEISNIKTKEDKKHSGEDLAIHGTIQDIGEYGSNKCLGSTASLPSNGTCINTTCCTASLPSNGTCINTTCCTASLPSNGTCINTACCTASLTSNGTCINTTRCTASLPSNGTCINTTCSTPSLPSNRTCINTTCSTPSLPSNGTCINTTCCIASLTPNGTCINTTCSTPSLTFNRTCINPTCSTPSLTSNGTCINPTCSTPSLTSNKTCPITTPSTCCTNEEKPPISPQIENLQQSLKPTDAVRTPVFYAVFLFGTATTYSLVLKANYYKQFALLYIHDDRYLTLVGSLIPVVAATARFSIGAALNRSVITIKDAIVFSLSVNSVLCAFWYVIPQVDAVLYLFFVLCLAIVQSMSYIILPVAALNTFGPAHFSTNYGLLQVCMLLVGLLSPVVTPQLLNTLGWLWLFDSASIFCLVTLLLVVCADFEPRKST